jgi:Atypical Arm repeat/Armadillo/beta-catenin-like repeat
MRGDDQQKKAILAHDPLSYMHRLCSSPDSEIRYGACSTIAIIVFDSQDEATKVFENNVVTPLLSCLADADIDVRKAAGLAVHFVAWYSPPPQIQLLVQQGCIPLLCHLLADGDALLGPQGCIPLPCDVLPDGDAWNVYHALMTIEYVLRGGGSLALHDGIGTTNPMAALLFEAGGVAKMKELLAHPHETIFEVAARVLTVYFGDGDEGEDKVPDDTAVEAAVAGTSEAGGDDGTEPPRQRLRLA